MRLICHIRGCDLHNDYHGCSRCGAPLYDVDFVQTGWIEPLESAYYRLKHWLRIKKCDVCGKRMPWRSTTPCCSTKCMDQWLPF